MKADVSASTTCRSSDSQSSTHRGVTGNNTSDSDGRNTNPTATIARTENAGISIPEDTVVIAFKDSLFYPNAQRNKTHALESVQLVYPSVGSPNYRLDNERSWSVAGERRLERLRKERGVTMKDMPLSVVVLDFAMVPFVDVTGITALAELKDDIRRNLGAGVELRLVHLVPGVRKRFERAKWPLIDVDGPSTRGVEGADLVFPTLERAVWEDREYLKGVVSEKA